MSDEIKDLTKEVTTLINVVFQMKDHTDKQTAILVKLENAISEVPNAIREVIELSKTQVGHKKDIEYVRLRCEQNTTRIDDFMREVTPDRVKNLEDRLTRVDDRVKQNAATDEAQNAQFTGLWQGFAKGAYGFLAAAVLAILGGVMGWIKLGGK